MNIIFMGTADFACETIRALHLSHHSILSVVTVPDRPAGRGRKPRSSSVKDLAVELGYSVLQPESLKNPGFLAEIRGLGADMIVVVAFRILPRDVFSIPQHGAINLHASLLPKYRGAAPVQHAILNNEPRTGVTIFRIDRKVDTGHILLQKEIELGDQMVAGEVFEKLSALGAEAVLEVADQIEQGVAESIPQDHSLACPAPKITAEDLRIDWSQPAQNIHNQIRAFSPSPGSYTTLDGKRMKLFDSRVTACSAGQLLPGKILPLDDRLVIGTSIECLQVRDVQLEGKRRMTVADFLRGYTFSTDDQFE